MTPADKEIVAEYMGWSFDDDANLYFYTNKELDLCIAHYDLNDASLCVSRMVEKGDWDDFMMIAKKCLTIHYSTEGKGWTEFIFTFVAWLFNADNFFQTMANWLRQK
jgi:hypothetical protein